MKLAVKIHECKDDPSLQDKLINCAITDFSSHGLHILTDTALVPNILLNINIDINKSGSRYELRGEIRWTKIIDNYCHMGVQFTENEASDLGAWAADCGDG